MAKKVKPKKCAVCELDFTPVYSTLQQVCSPLCAIKFNSEKEIDKRHNQLKIESRKLSWFEDVARKIFQLWIRLRDKDLPCISCGAANTKFDAGHYFKAELYSGMIFDEDNVHKQCCTCNDILEANLHEYRKGLIQRYGLEYVERLESRSDANRKKSWTREEYIEITEKYKHRVKLIRQ